MTARVATSSPSIQVTERRPYRPTTRQPSVELIPIATAAGNVHSPATSGLRPRPSWRNSVTTSPSPRAEPNQHIATAVPSTNPRDAKSAGSRIGVPPRRAVRRSHPTSTAPVVPSEDPLHIGTARPQFRTQRRDGDVEDQLVEERREPGGEADGQDDLLSGPLGGS